MPYTPLRIVAEHPKAALEQIHRQLGPEAVVLSVRRMPARGIARLWQRNGPVEILAGLPAQTQPRGSRKRLLSLAEEDQPASVCDSSPHRWRSIGRLESLGLLPRHARRLQKEMDRLYPNVPGTLEGQWTALRDVFAGWWPVPRPAPDGRPTSTHAFVGPPGSGKTTVLCKWLTLAVLTEERSARVWRLNGASANTAEFLTMHCEMLDVPVDRCWSEVQKPASLHLIDLPGTESDDSHALADLRSQLSRLPSPEVHLVLNAAYETEVLLAQCRAFAPLEPADLILTHCDEENRPVKLWNLILGTKYTIRFLSTGQKIPGGFTTPSLDSFFPAEISQ
jgi:flagellar biosynthesis GTPase FlhF